MLVGLSPWLHEEVARRMEQRLQWLVRAPRQWLHWGPLQGGLGAHALLRQRYPQATAYVVEESEPQLDAALDVLAMTGTEKNSTQSGDT